MKFIFLDIDGVFEHYDFIERSRVHRSSAFCPVSVQNVREVIKRTGAKIVVSSTWRRGRKVTQLRHLFNWYDLGQYVSGKTPVIDDEIRGKEIQAYLDAHPAESFVIIDDDADMGDLMPNLVQCKEYSGFIHGWQREMAIAILNKEPYVRLSELPQGSLFDHQSELIGMNELNQLIELHHIQEPIRLITQESTDTVLKKARDLTPGPGETVYSTPNVGPVVLIDVERSPSVERND